MEDSQIVALYFQRREEAIAATASKYGGFCYTIAYHILNDRLDAEETVSDSYMDVWKAIPPHSPNSFSAFLGKITRRNALDRWEYNHAEKRGGGEPLLILEELKDCISGGTDPYKQLEQAELKQLLNSFVRSLPRTEKGIFLSRYWKMEPIKEIAAQFGFSQSKVKSMLLRTRKKLRVHLEREGISV